MPPNPPTSFPFRLDFPPELPISARAEEIVATLQEQQVLILAGETGSGKTTQIPKLCLAAGRGTQGRIACTQPRRVAALSVSKRVAEELNVAWGREVGCKIRFADQTSRETVIKFLTDGMLLAEVQGDPLLRAYDTIIIDEAHERSLNIDFLLGHLRTLRFKRPELKIIITSATIDTQMFSEAFDGAPVIEVSGRTYPVEVIYAPLDALGGDFSEEQPGAEDAGARAAHRAEALHYIDGAVEAVRRIVDDSTAGDVLVFMPSERDIRETCEALDGALGRGCELVPLFGRLTNAEQQRVFAPVPKRKIIVATNIAETSLTIPGIRFVVDTGLARLSRYSPQARTRRLPIEPVAQSSADQRKGRAGRVAEGVCVRLYSEADFLERPRFTQPEIQRANLADVILRLKAFGLGDIERFPFINPPATKAIRSGYALLEELGALAEEGAAAADGGDARARDARKAGAEDPPHGRLLTGEGTRPTSSSASGNGGGSGTRELTAIGRELARLPVDPTVGRMILQARTEKCLREVLVIAAGLSIQDPRERPLEKQAAADAAHRRFRHGDSDFLTLLNIWEAYHGEFETMAQSKLRRFCREHFLSYTRMREWRDVHAQLADVLRERANLRMSSVADGMPVAPAGEGGKETKATRLPLRGADRERGKDPLAWGTPAYRAIHRSVLAGLLGNIAYYDEDNRIYKATHDRRVTLFPGSVLANRGDTKKAPGGGEAKAKRAAKPPAWIMAAEVVETSRLFARTCARLDPAWVLELASHLIKQSHSEPFWNEEKGRVMVKQRSRLYGLELDVRAVSFGRIDPVRATEIFIREGLVNDTITWPLDFIAHNRALREQVETSLTRTRDSSFLNLDEAFYRFYAERLRGDAVEREQWGEGTPPTVRAAQQGVSSVAELVDLVRRRQATEPRFLMMELADLRDPETLQHDAAEFPAVLPLTNQVLPLAYTYKPGQPDDGVTLDVHARDAAALTPAALDWAVPGHLAAKVEHYLGVLPKDVRRVLIPFADTVRSVSEQVAQRDRLTDRRETLPEALAAVLAERFNVRVAPDFWSDKPPPEHLRVRLRVHDDTGRELASSRELAEVRAALKQPAPAAGANAAQQEPEVWRRARARWEKPAQATWAFGAVPDRVQIGDQAGVAIYAFPGLRAEADGVALRLFRAAEEAERETRRGVSRLLEDALSRDLGWLERDLRRLRELGALVASIAPAEALQADAFLALRRWLIERTPPRLTEEGFAATLRQARADLQGGVPRLVALLREILTLRQALLVHPQPYAGLAAELEQLVPADFLRHTEFPRLENFPRYLKGMTLRAERWRKNPAKDAERAKELAPLVAAVAKRSREDPVRWLVEELRVSLFAQELGTAEPVSVVKVQRALQESGVAPGGKAVNAGAAKTSKGTPPPVPRVVPVDAGKKAPLKSLDALQRLFPR
ncbi:DUF3418 domain-containing protein [Horticoccus luteus]|uniref:DUF3418 domain-containing protein n=1 Tax=Horticoccus luteus TaxID=2862869 RepID=A0A8F9TVT5_9BACT|nr:DUF3418 domain-containing protein [Horticoccus luteus]QYM78497.1 DUF3418 domain-containing protein [Horticoccus luteus]